MRRARPCLAVCGLVLLLAALLGATCRKPPGLGTSAPAKSVYDPARGVSIAVPEDWKVTFRKSNPFLFAEAPGAAQNGPLVNVVEEQLSQRIGPYDYLQANIPTMRLSLNNFVMGQTGVEVSAGISLAWVHYGYTRNGQKIEALSYCQTSEYRAYIVTGIAPEQLFKTYEPVFRDIGKSLRLDPGR